MSPNEPGLIEKERLQLRQTRAWKYRDFNAQLRDAQRVFWAGLASMMAFWAAG